MGTGGETSKPINVYMRDSDHYSDQSVRFRTRLRPTEGLAVCPSEECMLSEVFKGRGVFFAEAG